MECRKGTGVNAHYYTGVILSSDNEDLAAVAELLAARVRNKLQYQHFQTVQELDFDAHYDFIVIDDLQVLREVVLRYDKRDTPAPLLIHLVFSDSVDLNNPYMELHQYGCTIAPIRQAPLDTQDTTLQFDLFERILEILDANQ